MGPGEIDALIIRRHLAALRESLQVLAARSDVSLEELNADTELLWVVERGLQLCAQNALDIATHIAAGRGRDVRTTPAPSTSSDASACSTDEFVHEFRNVAGFRNVLVHGYLDVDLDVLYTLLHDRLGDFESFAARIETHLENL